MLLAITRLLHSAARLNELRLNARLAWRLLGDIRVPLVYKLIVPLSAAYLIWPLDFIPDFLPFLGQFDDLTTVVVAILVFVRLCPPRLVAEHRADLLGRQRPRGPDDTVIEGQYRVMEDERRR
jgi:uncharacterized membrane protein YkvA (DUF1232 family)